MIESEASTATKVGRRIKILVVSDKYPPRTVGGAEISLHLQLKRIDPKLCDVRVATLDKKDPEAGEYPQSYIHDGIQVRRIGALPEWPPTLPAQHGLLPDRLRWPIGAARYLVEATNHPVRERVQVLSLHRDLSKSNAYNWMPIPDEDLLHFSEAVDRLNKIIEEDRPDLIHADNYRSILVTASANRRGAKFVALVRDNRFFCNRREQNTNIDGEVCVSCEHQCVPATLGDTRFKVSRLMRSIHQFRISKISEADEIVTTSAYLKDQIESTVSGKSVTVISNPSGGTRYIDEFQRGIERSTPPIILVVGMLNENKGAHRAIDWLKKIRAQLSDFRLVMAGSGRMSADLRARAHDASLSDYLHLPGYLSRPELFRMYARSSVVMAPNFWPEPFGRVPLEAGLSARPIVAYNVGGIGESIIDGKTGFLVPPKDETMLINRVLECIKNPILAEELGVSARRHILSDYNADVSAQRLMSMWSKLHDRPI